MFKINYHNQAGITLIEIMISITILAVGILGIVQVFPQGISTEKSIALASITEQLAQAKIEELMSFNYDSLNIGILENKVPINNDLSSPFYNFKRSVVVDLIDNNFNTTSTDIGLKKITVTIYQPENWSNLSQPLEITYLKAKR